MAASEDVSAEVFNPGDGVSFGWWSSIAPIAGWIDVLLLCAGELVVDTPTDGPSIWLYSEGTRDGPCAKIRARDIATCERPHRHRLVVTMHDGTTHEFSTTDPRRVSELEGWLRRNV